MVIRPFQSVTQILNSVQITMQNFWKLKTHIFSDSPSWINVTYINFINGISFPEYNYKTKDILYYSCVNYCPRAKQTNIASKECYVIEHSICLFSDLWCSQLILMKRKTYFRWLFKHFACKCSKHDTLSFFPLNALIKCWEFPLNYRLFSPETKISGICSTPILGRFGNGARLKHIFW